MYCYVSSLENYFNILNLVIVINLLDIGFILYQLITK